MKFCSVCLVCYDDTIAICAVEDHGSLIQARKGNCLMIEGYRIDSRIDSVSPVELYKATHLASEKSVLIRFIEDDDSCTELRKDLEAVAGINHPNLARVFEFGKAAENEYFVVLEDISGQNLGEFMQRIAPLLERDAIQIARQIAEGLEELHSAGVIHRAVNPWNIYFKISKKYNFEVKLQNYDFGGIVQKIVSDGINGVDAKKELFRYYSPEQFENDKLDFRSDIYSLAVVFYEMLLGRSPYNSLNPQTISDYIFQECVVEELHHDLRALLGYTLRESLHHRSDLRPQTTNNFVRQLRHLELVATPAELALLDEPRLPTQKKQIDEVSQVNLKIDDFDYEPKVETLVVNDTNNQPFELDLPDIAQISNKIQRLQVENSKFEIIEYVKPEIQKIEENDFDLIDDFSLAENEKFIGDNGHFETNKELFGGKTKSNRFLTNSFKIIGQNNYASIGKTTLYAVGLVALIFFSGFLTARIFEGKGIVSSSINTFSAETENLNDPEQIQEKTKKELEENGEISKQNSDSRQIQKTQENELLKTDKTEVQTYQKNSSQKLISSKPQNKNTKQRSVNNATVKAPNAKKENPTIQKKDKKIKPVAESDKTKTRPRFVLNETIVIDPSKIRKEN